MDGFARAHVAGDVENSLRRSMGDQDVDVVRDRLPNDVQYRARLHVSPVEEHWCVRRAEDLQSVPLRLFMDQKRDVRIIACSNQSLLDGGRVIARHKKFGGDRQCGIPLEESSGLRFIHPRISMRRFVAAVDNGVRVRDFQPVVFAVSVGDEPEFHVISQGQEPSAIDGAGRRRLFRRSLRVAP